MKWKTCLIDPPYALHCRLLLCGAGIFPCRPSLSPAGLIPVNLNLATALMLSGFMGLPFGLLGSGGTLITVPASDSGSGIPVAQAVTDP